MSIPETPYTRLEMYLDEIARNGGGGGGGGGSSSLSGLTDVDISNPADGQTLVYNATSGKWENGAGGGGGGIHVIGLIVTPGEDVTLDVTAGTLFGWLQAGDFVALFDRVSEPDYVTCTPIAMYVQDVEEQGYAFAFEDRVFACQTADEYPSLPL